ncbi:hypothetical protein DFH09DRAFT_952599 [Mycena vulgaris]|nr:hypothetical protein DFH09DRAFT_952599 [Mycena vulgaris]
MAPTPPEGLTVRTLITAKGTELKFWIVKTNEGAGEKVLKVSGTVDQLRRSLATYYGLDLTIIPRLDAITAPTIDESIRDRQWADLEALGVEWRETVMAGGTFKLLKRPSVQLMPPTRAEARVDINPILLIPVAVRSDTNSAASRSIQDYSDVSEPIISRAESGINNQSPAGATGPAERPGAPQPHLPTAQLTAPIPSSSPNQSPASSADAAASQREAAILQDLSAAIAGLERCDGLREVIQQIESGAVKEIRDRYGPAEYGRRGTADPSWPKYSNLVSKRERLHRILTQDFGNNKDKFFGFFSVAPPASKKRKRADNETTQAAEHFRSFRKIVEALPWCEADLKAERQQDQYVDSNGEFDEALWTERWDPKNAWEIWREIGRERYVKEKEKVPNPT